MNLLGWVRGINHCGAQGGQLDGRRDRAEVSTCGWERHRRNPRMDKRLELAPGGDETKDHIYSLQSLSFSGR